MRLVFIGFVFWLSGLAALTYEILWYRMLSTTFGASGPALAATTGAFMAGLGLGSRLIASRADSIRSPLRTYAILELMLGAIAFFMPALIKAVNHIYQQQITGDTSSVFAVSMQFVLLFGLLVTPTAIMGATLPLLCRALVDQDQSLGRKFAWLYGINTFGAASGALITGFLLIQAFGMRATSVIAVCINVSAALLALSVRSQGHSLAPTAGIDPKVITSGQASTDHTDSQTTGALDSCSSAAIVFSVFVCGFVGLACQNLWIRSLLFDFDRLKNTTYSFSSVLTVTLIALTLGTAFSGWFVDRSKTPGRLLGMIIALLGFSVAVSVVVLLATPKLQDIVDPETLRVDFAHAVTSVVARTAFVVGIPCVLMGMAMPLAVKSLARHESIGRHVGRLYAVNTLGAVLGAIAAAFVLPATLGLLPSILVLGGLALLAAIWLLDNRKLLQGGLAVAMISITGLAILLPEDTWQLQTLRPGEFIVDQKHGVSGTVCVIENELGERRICVDDVPVAGTSNIMQTDQKSLAHWSMLLAESPRKALTVGFGSGGASYSFLLHDQLEELHCVEISPDVPRMAKHLKDANHGLLEKADDRYRIIFQDARAYLAATDQTYDMIVSDCTDLRYRSSANLYDLEYFQLCRDRMTEGGCTTIWMPLGGLSRDAFQMTLNTFRQVFPEMTVHYLHNRWTHYVLLIGSQQAPKFRIDHVQRILEEPDVRRDMAEIGMTDPFKIAATFLTSGPRLKQVIQNAPLNTEDRPRLEFEVPRSDMGPWSAQKNLDFLRLYRGSIRSVLAPEITPEDQQNAARYHEAARHILTAQAAARTFRYEQAAREYLTALSLTPEDDSVREALEFPELVQLSQSGQPTATLLLGRVQQLQNNRQQAAELFRKFEAQMNQLNGDRNPEQEAWYQQGTLWQSTATAWNEELRQSDQSP